MYRKILLFIAFLIPVVHVGAADLVAEVNVRSDSITLYPQVPYAQLELTVVGHDIYWQQKYGEGEVAAFSTFDEVLVDGQYRFELITSPTYDAQAWKYAKNDPKMRRDLEVIERAGTFRQTGRFEVVQGQISLITEPDE